MLHLLFVISFLFTTPLFAKICPKSSYYVHPHGPQQISGRFVTVDCYSEKFFYRGCSQFYDDLICAFTTADGKYELNFIDSDGYGQSISELYFHHSRPQNCPHKPNFKQHTGPDHFVHKITIKGKAFAFYRTGCQTSEGSYDSKDLRSSPYYKSRCEFRSPVLKDLRLIDTSYQWGRKKFQYLIGCN